MDEHNEANNMDEQITQLLTVVTHLSDEVSNLKNIISEQKPPEPQPDPVDHFKLWLEGR